MTMWYGLVDENGTLVSLSRGDGSAYVGPLSVVQFVDGLPDFTAVVWDRATRSLIPREQPVFRSRLDDFEASLANDPDWRTAWQALSTTRRTQLRTGLRRVLKSFVGEREWRRDDEAAELD